MISPPPRSLRNRFKTNGLIDLSLWGSISKILCLSLLVLFSAVASAGTINVTYYHNDATGSPVAATNAAGEVIWRKDYTPYGKASGKDGNNRRGYTGHVEEQNGLVYAGARYYNPDWGRFLSVDPAGFSAGNPMSFNRYAYANNNPYKYVDPDGRIVETVWDVANVVMDVSSMGMNLADGNYGAAAVDAAGLIFDGAATIIPGMPGGAGVMIKSKRAADKLADAAKQSDKAFSKEKEALVDMAKSDKKTGITPADMDTYKDLNKDLPDPFPPNKVRQDIGGGKPYDGNAGHGHVGPVNHIPINEKKL